MILSGCSLIVKDEAVDAARVVIRVGDDTYTKAQVQAQIQNQVNYMTALYSRYGLSFDSTNADVMSRLTDNVLNSLVERSVLLAKAKELGLDQLTDEEKTKIEEDTASQLDSLRQSAATEFPLTSKRSWRKSTPSWRNRLHGGSCPQGHDRIPADYEGGRLRGEGRDRDGGRNRRGLQQQG